MSLHLFNHSHYTRLLHQSEHGEHQCKMRGSEKLPWQRRQKHSPHVLPGSALAPESPRSCLLDQLVTRDGYGGYDCLFTLHCSNLWMIFFCVCNQIYGSSEVNRKVCRINCSWMLQLGRCEKIACNISNFSEWLPIATLTECLKFIAFIFWFQ